MAGKSVTRTIKLRDYFDSLAPTWDTRISEEDVKRLRDIIAKLDIKPGSHILDIGSGTGVLVPLLVPATGDNGSVIELDISAKMLLKAKVKGFRGNIHYLQADAGAIPLSEAIFDLVICNNTFPHFNDKLKTLIETARVIKDGGRLVICHTMSREVVNNLHRTIGGVVGDDFLPEEAELCWLLSRAGLEKVWLEDSPERYLVIIGKKSAPFKLQADVQGF